MRFMRNDWVRHIAMAGVAVLSALVLPAAAAAQLTSLPNLRADARQTSLSGISSGAYMAGQYQFAHADTVVGAAIIAGGPYGCADARSAASAPQSVRLWANASKALNGCTSARLSWFGIPNVKDLAARARNLASAGRIAPLEALKNQRVYLFSGTQDDIVASTIVASAQALYKELGVPAANIVMGPRLPAGHGFVTDASAQQCENSRPPFVVACGYDQAGALLTHMYGPLSPRAASASGTRSVFDQRPFAIHSGRAAGLAPSGTIYVPGSCTTEPGCRIHVALHGCEQNRAAVGDAFVAGAGYDRWADSNRIIVLFPEVAADPSRNPLGCWDWWGYTGLDFTERSAPQIAAIHAMIEHLAR